MKQSSKPNFWHLYHSLTCMYDTYYWFVIVMTCCFLVNILKLSLKNVDVLYVINTPYLYNCDSFSYFPLSVSCDKEISCVPGGLNRQPTNLLAHVFYARPESPDYVLCAAMYKKVKNTSFQPVISCWQWLIYWRIIPLSKRQVFLY